jgi:hypothetical protein
MAGRSAFGLTAGMRWYRLRVSAYLSGLSVSTNVFLRELVGVSYGIVLGFSDPDDKVKFAGDWRDHGDDSDGIREASTPFLSHHPQRVLAMLQF